MSNRFCLIPCHVSSSLLSLNWHHKTQGGSFAWWRGRSHPAAALSLSKSHLNFGEEKNLMLVQDYACGHLDYPIPLKEKEYTSKTTEYSIRFIAALVEINSVLSHGWRNPLLIVLVLEGASCTVGVHPLPLQILSPDQIPLDSTLGSTGELGKGTTASWLVISPGKTSQPLQQTWHGSPEIMCTAFLWHSSDEDILTAAVWHSLHPCFPANTTHLLCSLPAWRIGSSLEMETHWENSWKQFRVLCALNSVGHFSYSQIWWHLIFTRFCSECLNCGHGVVKNGKKKNQFNLFRPSFKCV